MSEARLWARFRKEVGKIGDWNRIESHSTADGFPDCVGCVNGVPIFLELKYSGTPTPPKIRPSQVRWHNRWDKAGGKSWFLIEWNEVYILIEGYMIKHLVGNAELEKWLSASAGYWYKEDEEKWQHMLDVMMNY